MIGLKIQTRFNTLQIEFIVPEEWVSTAKNTTH